MVLPFVISYRCSGDNLQKYKANSFYLIMSYVFICLVLFSHWYANEKLDRVKILTNFYVVVLNVCWEACQKKQGLPVNVKLTSLRILFQGT